jgi:hypothetical protein
MTNLEMYIRLLTEMHHSVEVRPTSTTRMELQDVLTELRNRAVADAFPPHWHDGGRGIIEQEVQDYAESEARIARQR